MKVESVLTIGIPELSLTEWERLEKKLTFGKNNGDVVIAYRRLIARSIYQIPRGAWYLLPDHIRYDDLRSRPKMPRLKFMVKLDDVEKDERFKGQRQAVDAMFANEQGLVIRPPGTGKTQVALAFAAECETSVLVLVHTEDILNQWVEYIGNAIPELKGKVGVIRGKECTIGQITVATVQTLNRSYLEKPKKWWAQFGAVIADEAHHVSAPTWEVILNNCPAYYRFGFTASPTRADGMHPTMKFIIGPVIHRQKFTSPIDLKVVPVKTNFKFQYRGPYDWTPLTEKLIRSKRRNQKIADIADREIERGNSVLVLSRRIEHLERIGRRMSEDAEILTGERTGKDRKEILRRFKAGEIRCLLSTQLADEALDVPVLNRVLLTFPGKHEGRIIQQIGRALRNHPDKENAVIYDFYDHRIKPLRRQWNQRKRTYRKEGIRVKKIGRLKW
jgi:superfamily II DNA or RNA helicase